MTPIPKWVRRLVFPLFLVVILGLFSLGDISSHPRAEGPRQDDPSSSSSCILTPQLLGGQGYSVTELGFSVTELGFSVTELGFSVTELGFSVTELGLDPADVASEIANNPIDSQWLLARTPDIVGGIGFNDVPTAIIVVDDFSQADSHGEKVFTVLEDLYNNLPSEVDRSKIQLVKLDVSGSGVSYQTDLVAPLIRETIEGTGGLIEQGYQHFVINLSFGLIPCDAPATEIEGTPVPAFSYQSAVRIIQEENEPQDPQPVRPVLECVVDNEEGYTAYFGYLNENDAVVSIPVGENNQFSSGSQNRDQPRVFEPGRQHFAFAVDFDGDNLVWTLEGPDGSRRTSTASPNSTRCETIPPFPEEEVSPVLECVIDKGDKLYTARFGYNNPNESAVTIPVGSNNRFSPTPQDRAQTITFLPGRHRDVFEVDFDGSNLVWSLNGMTSTASSESDGCINDLGYGLDNYLTEQMNIPPDLVDKYFAYLFTEVEEDVSLGSLQTLLQEYLARSADPADTFAAFAIASAGNFAPWLGTAPLTPASWPETISVCATLGNEGPIWQFSQYGDMCAPGAGYQFSSLSFGAGTSYAAPFASMASGLWLTYPDACVFDGTNPPLVADVLANRNTANALINPGGTSPLACFRNQAPSITNPGDQMNAEGDTVSLQIEAEDLDEDPLTFSAEGLPPGLSIDETSGLISGTLGFDAAGTYEVMVTVSDGSRSASATFGWEVTDTPQNTEVCYATNVVTYDPGTRKNGKSINHRRQNTDKALGAPQDNNTLNFVSLGFGDQETTGVIVLDFEPYMILNINGPAPDFRVWETTYFDQYRKWERYPEAVRVEASQDGLTWHVIGETSDKDEAYDLGDDLAWVRYIRLTEISDRSLKRFKGNADGFDLDGIEGFNCNKDRSQDPAEVCYATDDISYLPGLRKNGTAVPNSRNKPERALGEPQDNNTLNYVALGLGGELVLGFAPYQILNENGALPDFRVWETTYNDRNKPWSRFPEAVHVEASQDGENWVDIGVTTDKDQAYDLGKLSWASYIRLTDITDADNKKFGGSTDGFDVDGIEGFACVSGVSVAAAVPEADNLQVVSTSNERIESDDTRVVQAGSWAAQATPQASLGRYLYSGGSDADTLTLEFEGTSIEVIYVAHSSFAMFTIMIDGEAVRTVSATSGDSTFDNRAVVDYLEPGKHTLQIVPVDGVVAIDAFQLRTLY
jgi:hypothetical protein